LSNFIWKAAAPKKLMELIRIHHQFNQPAIHNCTHLFALQTTAFHLDGFVASQ
jgi:hypothetical protein